MTREEIATVIEGSNDALAKLSYRDRRTAIAAAAHMLSVSGVSACGIPTAIRVGRSFVATIKIAIPSDVR